VFVVCWQRARWGALDEGSFDGNQPEPVYRLTIVKSRLFLPVVSALILLSCGRSVDIPARQSPVTTTTEPSTPTTASSTTSKKQATSPTAADVVLTDDDIQGALNVNVGTRIRVVRVDQKPTAGYGSGTIVSDNEEVISADLHGDEPCPIEHVCVTFVAHQTGTARLRTIPNVIRQGGAAPLVRTIHVDVTQ
jgi:hypothetical protein